LAALFDFVREVNVLLDAGMVSRSEAEEVDAIMKRFDGVLGVVSEVAKKGVLSKEAEELIAKREAARKAKDWGTADALRAQLSELGVVVEDTVHGVRWHLVKKT
jgi:cysteinyl-tRNA synthetase